MFKNVVVGVDGRPSGRDAIALATQLAEPGATLTFTHVISGVYKPSHAVIYDVVEEDCAKAEALLQAERDSTGVGAQLEVAQAATPGQGLHESADTHKGDLLVLGSCHRGVVGRAMLGDDTRSALNGAPCAIAVAPAGYAEQSKPLSKIGVGYDGRPESKVALQAAKNLAASTGAEIIAMHMVNLPAYAYGAIGAVVLTNLDAAVEEAEKEMRALEGVEGRAQYGLGSDLAYFAEEVDLLVVGSRGYGPWGRLIHGSTSSRLARHTRGPLLIVPRAVAASADADPAEPANAAVPV